jgi:hypothetical protein
VKVRVQARDGKILGPAKTVKQPTLSVRDVRRNEYVVIPNPNFDTRSSGTVKEASAFRQTFSRNAIVVEPPPIEPPPPVEPPFPQPGPYWLETPIGEGELIVSLPLTEPSLLEFTATAYAPDKVYASATMWVMPGMELLADPGLVLTIAGLYTTVEASAVGGTVTVTATVTMMCGCPITVAPPKPPPAGEELYWPETEFEVTARYRKVGGAQGESDPFALSFATTNTFCGSVQLAPGIYVVSVVALQRKETNVGFASTSVEVR